jgi:hypothetical protein
MAKKKDKKPVSIREGLDLALEKMEKASKARAVMRATDISADWRYIDFVDVTNNRPCLPLEWLHGTRGLICGRILKYNATYAAGKSANVFMNCAMGQRGPGVYATLLESEDAPPPPDFMYHLGCNPDELIVQYPNNVVNCLDEAESFIKIIRESVDPDKKHPIIVAIDSVSGLAQKTLNPTSTQKKEEDKQGKVAFHSRAFSEFFREKLQLLTDHDVVMVATGQMKANIGSQSVYGAKAGDQTTIADAPFSYHATWVVEINHSKWWIDGQGDVGEVITCKTTKNKVASRGRQIKIYLMKPELCNGKPGWDFTDSHKMLFKNNNPFREGEYTNNGGWHKHPRLLGGKSTQDFDEFLQALYDNEEVLMECREKLRIRGFGFPFETDYIVDEVKNAGDT